MVERYLGDDVDGFLADHGLTRADIEWWVCHPGGPKVIEALEEALGAAARGACELTWDSLARIGNLSSASVLHVLEDTLRDRPPRPGLLRACCWRWGPASAPSWCCCGPPRTRDDQPGRSSRSWSPWSGSSGSPSSSSPSATPPGASSTAAARPAAGTTRSWWCCTPGCWSAMLVEAWVRRPDVPPALAWSMLALVARLPGAALVVHRAPSAGAGTPA